MSSNKFSALQNYLSPIPSYLLPPASRYTAGQWGSKLKRYAVKGNFEGLQHAQIALIGISQLPKETPTDTDPIEPNLLQAAPTTTADNVRPHLYKLYSWESDFRVADLGNLLAGLTTHDTLHALSAVVEILLRENIIPFIIGNEHHETVGQFWGHGMLDKPISAIVFDPKLDLGQHTDNELSSDAFLYKILDDPRLYDFTLAGYQRYLVNADWIDTLEQLNFDCYSLGDIRRNVQEVEPMVRQMQMLSFDLSSLKYTHASAVPNAGPNGFNSEDACAIMRYAGMSDHITSMGLYGYNFQNDHSQQTARLLAQMIWHFTDGFYNRKYDFPDLDQKHFLQYIVHLKESDQDLTFLKSRKSDRWWIRVPKTAGTMGNADLVPCSYNDYQAACRDEIPERWLKAILRHR